MYRTRSFWINMADATYVSFVTFFICFGAYLNTNVGLMEFGTTLITAHLAVMYLHLAIETKSWVSTEQYLINVYLQKNQKSKSHNLKGLLPKTLINYEFCINIPI